MLVHNMEAPTQLYFSSVMQLASHTDCNRNYSGSSGGMEATAAEIFWNRSVIHDFRYTTLFSEGDAKTFSHLCSLNVYGQDVSLVKEECVNHVAKT